MLLFRHAVSPLMGDPLWRETNSATIIRLLSTSILKGSVDLLGAHDGTAIQLCLSISLVDLLPTFGARKQSQKMCVVYQYIQFHRVYGFHRRNYRVAIVETGTARGAPFIEPPAAAVSQRRHNSRPRNTNLSRGREGGELYSRPCARHGTVLIHPGALSRRKKPYGYKCVAIYSGRVLAGKTLATEKTTTRRGTPEKNDRL